jgi:butyrate response factor 1
MVKDDSSDRKLSIESIDKSKDKYKTELCRTWVEHNYCPYREKCRFAHGKKDLHEKLINNKNYKQKECNSFYTKGFCPYGPRCHFKHDERRVDDMERYYYKFILEKNIQKRLNVFEEMANPKIIYITQSSFHSLYANHSLLRMF